MNQPTVLIRRRASLHAVTYVLLLCCSLAVLGGLGLVFTISASNSLEQLRNETLPAGVVLRRVTREAGKMRRSVDLIETAQSAGDIAHVRENIEEFRRRNDENLKQLQLLVNDEEMGRLLTAVVTQRHRFLHDLEALLQISDMQHSPSEMFQAKIAMNTSYEIYRDQQDILAEHCERRALQLSNAVLVKAKRFELFGVLTALWPFLSGGVLFSYGLISTALIFLKERRAD